MDIRRLLYICLYPGCDDFRMPSEDTLDLHVASHFGNNVLGEPLECLYGSAPERCPRRALPPFPKPTDADEETTNRVVLLMKEGLKVDIKATLSLIRKLNIVRPSRRGCGYRVSSYLTRNGADVAITLHHLWKEVSPARRLTLGYGPSPNTLNEDLSPYSWVCTMMGIQDACLCSCCVFRTIRMKLKRLDTIKCSIADCGESLEIWGLDRSKALKKHWLVHCLVSGWYRCDVPGCTHKFRRATDLQRHILTNHCLNAGKFPCTFPGCARGNDNGFPRKDKLKSHFESVHRGVGIPSKQPRALAPKNGVRAENLLDTTFE